MITARLLFSFRPMGMNLSRRLFQNFPDWQRRFTDKQIQFFLINSMGLQNRDDVQAEMERLGVDLPVLMDDAQIIGEALV